MAVAAIRRAIDASFVVVADSIVAGGRAVAAVSGASQAIFAKERFTRIVAATLAAVGRT